MKSGHGACEPRVEIRPNPVHDLLKMAHQGQHRQDRLNEDAILPLSPRTQFEVGRIAFACMESRIAQDDHASVDLANQPLKRWISRRTTASSKAHTDTWIALQHCPFVRDSRHRLQEVYGCDHFSCSSLTCTTDRPLG